LRSAAVGLRLASLAWVQIPPRPLSSALPFGRAFAFGRGQRTQRRQTRSTASGFSLGTDLGTPQLPLYPRGTRHQPVRAGSLALACESTTPTNSVVGVVFNHMFVSSVAWARRSAGATWAAWTRVDDGVIWIAGATGAAIVWSRGTEDRRARWIGRRSWVAAGAVAEARCARRVDRRARFAAAIARAEARRAWRRDRRSRLVLARTAAEAWCARRCNG
jgi:hypothetical protein